MDTAAVAGVLRAWFPQLLEGVLQAWTPEDVEVALQGAVVEQGRDALAGALEKTFLDQRHHVPQLKGFEAAWDEDRAGTQEVLAAVVRERLAAY